MCLAFIGLFIYKGLLCFAMCIPTNFIMSEAMQCHWAVIVCATLGGMVVEMQKEWAFPFLENCVCACGCACVSL